MRKTKRLHKAWHQSGLPKHYRKSVMRRSFTKGLVRLTTTDIFEPYEKLETPQWNSLAWELFNRGIEGRDINTRGARFVRTEEEK